MNKYYKIAHQDLISLNILCEVRKKIVDVIRKLRGQIYKYFFIRGLDRINSLSTDAILNQVR